MTVDQTKNVIRVQESLTQTLRMPSPSSLRQLRSDLLVFGMPNDASEMRIIDEFYQFLNELISRSTAREYSHFASILDMAAVGGVAIQNLFDKDDSEDWWKRMVIGAVSEVLMVMAARQYVKAWESEMQATYHSAAWFLGEEFWLVSAELQPDLNPDHRRLLIDRLFLPINEDSTAGTTKAALLVHFFQLLLLLRLKMRVSK